MLHSYVHRWVILGQTGTQTSWPKGQKHWGRSLVSQIRYSVRICQHPFPTFPTALRTSRELRPEQWNVNRIHCSQQAKKKPTQKSPLLQTHPSKRDISWCFCKEMPRQGCFCCKKDVLVTDSCCSAPRMGLEQELPRRETSQALLF